VIGCEEYVYDDQFSVECDVGQRIIPVNELALLFFSITALTILSWWLVLFVLILLVEHCEQYSLLAKRTAECKG